MSEKFTRRMRKRLGMYGSNLLLFQLSRHLRAQPKEAWLEFYTPDLDKMLRKLSSTERRKLRVRLQREGYITVRPKNISRGKPQYLFRFTPDNLRTIQRDFGVIVHDGEPLEVAEEPDCFRVTAL